MAFEAENKRPVRLLNASKRLKLSGQLLLSKASSETVINISILMQLWLKNTYPLKW